MHNPPSRTPLRLALAALVAAAPAGAQPTPTYHLVCGPPSGALPRGGSRSRGAHVVLVTSTQRRDFDSAGRVANTLGDYPEAMRRAAAEERVPLVDLSRPDAPETFDLPAGPLTSAAKPAGS